MAKPEWGLKRLCGSCGCRFYDMMRTPILCPKCGATYEHEPTFKTRRATVTAETKSKVQPILADESINDADPDLIADIDDDVLDDADDVDADAADEEDETLIEDASDLGEDDDDMAEVMEHLDEAPEDEA